MNRSALKIVAASLLLVATANAPRAALDATTPAQAGNGYELIVMEAPGCIYCGLFRRDVLPTFKTSERAKELPLRFLDVNDIEQDRVVLNSPVEIVPTFVVAKKGKEVGRIPGYVGPETFFQSITRLMSSAP